MIKLNIIIVLFIFCLQSCCTNDCKSGTSTTASYIKNLTPYRIKISFYKDSINSYETKFLNPNENLEVSSNGTDGFRIGNSFNSKIYFDDSVVFQFNTDTFLTHYNRQIDTSNKNGYGITWPNNILNPLSFKQSKIKETKRVAYYEFIYEITNQDFLKAKK